MTHNDQVRQILASSNFSMTKPRLTVFEMLHATDEPITIAALAQKLKDVDRASIYRTIALFEELGIVHRVWNGFKSKIELSETFSPHHHHFTCTSCGSLQALDSEELEKSLHELELANGFVLTYHSVELKGTCKKCTILHVQETGTSSKRQ